MLDGPIPDGTARYPIPAGARSLLIGQAKVVERPACYHVEVLLRAVPSLAAQPERLPYADARPLSTGPRWYAGEIAWLTLAALAGGVRRRRDVRAGRARG